MNQIINLETVPRWDGTPNPPVQYDAEYLYSPDFHVQITTITRIHTGIESDDPITWREVRRILNEGAA